MSDAATGCQEFEADLSALLDDELVPERAAEMRAHVGACQGCRGRLARLERVDAALASAPELPASLRARLEARLETGRGIDTSARRAPWMGAPRRAWRGRAAGALAAAAAGVALYLAVVSREPARPEAEPSPAQIAGPSAETPREAPQQVAKRPAASRPAPAPPVAEPPLDLEAVSEEDLELALELETVEDLDVIANLELLELLLASEAG